MSYQAQGFFSLLLVVLLCSPLAAGGESAEEGPSAGPKSEDDSGSVKGKNKEKEKKKEKGSKGKKEKDVEPGSNVKSDAPEKEAEAPVTGQAGEEQGETEGTAKSVSPGETGPAPGKSKGSVQEKAATSVKEPTGKEPAEQPTETCGPAEHGQTEEEQASPSTVPESLGAPPQEGEQGPEPRETAGPAAEAPGREGAAIGSEQPGALPGSEPVGGNAVESTPEASKEEQPQESKEEQERKHFVKGELLDVGAFDLLGNRSRAGAKVGYRAIGKVHYITVEPEVDLRFGKFKLGLSGPLNIEIWDGSEGLVSVNATEGSPKTEIKGFDNAGSIRSEDWDHWRDYFKILKYLGWGRKEDNLYVNIGQSAVGSIGHGLIMKRYLPQVDLDTIRLGAQFDAYLDWLGGFEFYTGDITKFDVMGVLGFIKPLAPFIDGYMARSLSIGFTFATDRNAPTSLAPLGVDDDKNGTDDRDVVLLDNGQDNTLPKAAGTKAVSILGIDTELKVLKNDTSDIKVYVDFSKMLDAGYGFTGGMLGRFNMGDKLVHAFRVRAEARYFTADYLPSYFDSFYQIDRWQFMTGSNKYYSKQAGLPLTKYQVVKSGGSDSRFGYFLEFGYAVVNYVSLGGALEGQTPDSMYNLLLSLSIPWSDYARLAVTYQKRHFSRLADAFDLTKDNAWLAGLVRIKLLPILYLNGQVGHIWSLNREVYKDTKLPGPDYGLYQAHFDWRVWLDVAYEF